MKKISEFIIENCEKFSDNTILLDEWNRAITYASFLTNFKAARHYFETNIKEGGYNFSIIAPNSQNYLYALFSLLDLGGCAVNLNPNLSPLEIKDRLNIGKATILVTTTNIYQILLDILPFTGVKLIFIIDEKSSEFNEAKVIIPQSFIQQERELNEHTAFLQFTGGTTGIIKAALITHQNVLDNIEQLHSHFSRYTKVDGLKVLIAFPFYHIFSIVFNLLFFIRNGNTCVLYTDLRNTDLIVNLLKMQGINFTVGVNTWYKKLMQHPHFSTIDFIGIRASMAGGEYVPNSTKEQWRKLTGKPLFSAYGLTETASLAIISPLDETNFDDSIGIAIPGTEVALLDDEGYEIEENGRSGEIALKGPQVTSAYYQNLIETAQAFYNGWFKTGDIAVRVNDKFYKIIDRKKDMISVSGNKVYPNEVEAIVSRLSGIMDLAVVGLKSDESGEEVAICIVEEAANQTSNEEIINYCRLHLSRFKVPKHIFRYKELPKTPIGKTDRKKLREQINQI
jgi:long-chain acyl-CoA synthetase